MYCSCWNNEEHYVGVTWQKKKASWAEVQRTEYGTRKYGFGVLVILWKLGWTCTSHCQGVVKLDRVSPKTGKMLSAFKCLCSVEEHELWNVITELHWFSSVTESLALIMWLNAITLQSRVNKGRTCFWIMNCLWLGPANNLSGSGASDVADLSR